jgi:hypothetical protein
MGCGGSKPLVKEDDAQRTDSISVRDHARRCNGRRRHAAHAHAQGRCAVARGGRAIRSCCIVPRAKCLTAAPCHSPCLTCAGPAGHAPPGAVQPPATPNKSGAAPTDGDVVGTPLSLSQKCVARAGTDRGRGGGGAGAQLLTRARRALEQGQELQLHADGGAQEAGACVVQPAPRENGAPRAPRACPRAARTHAPQRHCPPPPNPRRRARSDAGLSAARTHVPLSCGAAAVHTPAMQTPQQRTRLSSCTLAAMS